MATDFIAFDNAVKTALEFAEADGDTLVIAAPDHNTGGLTVGTYVYEYTDRSVEFAREPFLNFEMTGGTLLSMIGKPYDEITAEELIDAVKKYWHIDLKTEEAEEIIAYPAKNAGVLRSTPGNNPDLSYALSRRVSELYTIAGWTSHGHTAETSKYSYSYSYSYLCYDHRHSCFLKFLTYYRVYRSPLVHVWNGCS